MGTLVSCLLTVTASLLATSVFVLVFSSQILLAVIPRAARSPPANITRRSVAVLVPAHNECLGIASTIINVRSQLKSHDRLIVVADNCSDDTAAVSSAAGADVIERKDLTKRGKGFALDCGVRQLNFDPREIVIIVDADCQVESGAIDELASTCTATGRPTQALYLMTVPAVSQINHQVAEFSWRVKNWMRPLGLQALHLPCQLMGTGMAFPWGSDLVPPILEMTILSRISSSD